MSVLSGYAIYLGRFVRINSWEIVSNPIYLIQVLLGYLDWDGFRFMGLFGVMVFGAYMAFYLMQGFQLHKGNN